MHRPGTSSSSRTTSKSILKSPKLKLILIKILSSIFTILFISFSFSCLIIDANVKVSGVSTPNSRIKSSKLPSHMRPTHSHVTTTAQAQSGSSSFTSSMPSHSGSAASQIGSRLRPKIISKKPSSSRSQNHHSSSKSTGRGQSQSSHHQPTTRATYDPTVLTHIRTSASVVIPGLHMGLTMSGLPTDLLPHYLHKASHHLVNSGGHLPPLDHLAMGMKHAVDHVLLNMEKNVVHAVTNVPWEPLIQLRDCIKKFCDEEETLKGFDMCLHMCQDKVRDAAIESDVNGQTERIVQDALNIIVKSAAPPIITESEKEELKEQLAEQQLEQEKKENNNNNNNNHDDDDLVVAISVDCYKEKKCMDENILIPNAWESCFESCLKPVLRSGISSSDSSSAGEIIENVLLSSFKDKVDLSDLMAGEGLGIEDLEIKKTKRKLRN